MFTITKIIREKVMLGSKVKDASTISDAPNTKVSQTNTRVAK